MKAAAIPSDPTVRRIVEASRKEFFALGFSRVTMDDLAEKLGMSKKTLYRHFPGKEMLLEAVIQCKLRSAERDLEAALAGAAPSAHARLSAAIACLMEHIRELGKPFIRDMQRLAPEVFERVQKRRQEMIHRHLGAVIEEGVRSGELRGDIPPGIALEILLGTVNAVMNPAKLEELRAAPQDALTAIFAIFLEGMFVRKGGRK